MNSWTGRSCFQHPAQKTAAITWEMVHDTDFPLPYFYPTLVYNVMNLRPSGNQELWPFLPIKKFLFFIKPQYWEKIQLVIQCILISIYCQYKKVIKPVPHILNLFFTPFYSITLMCTVHYKQSYGPVLGLDLLIE